MPEIAIPWWFVLLFFGVALLYSSVGHGGASGYLALFALLGMAGSEIVPAALILNVLVAGMSFVMYMRGGFFSGRLLLPFILGSVPSAFLGGWLPLSSIAFSAILGIVLVAAAIRMLFLRQGSTFGSSVQTKTVWFWQVAIGVVLGCVSGMVGIGGGIFLSPILLSLKWADVKQTAGVSSAFIVINSLGGLIGHSFRDNIHVDFVAPIGLAVVAGGICGSFTGARIARPVQLQRVLALVLVIAGGKLLFPILF